MPTDPVTEREALIRELRSARLPLESGMTVSRSEGNYSFFVMFSMT